MSNDGDLNNMWNEATQGIANIDPAAENWKIQSLPLARVKKIMKSEEIIMQELERERLRQEQAQNGDAAESPERTNVKFMISGEAPVLMSKACELLIKDLSFRAWQHTERNRRRTLQRQDLHAAVGESEVYDFLIDIVPRVQTAQVQAPPAAAAAAATMGVPDMSMMQAAIPTTYHQIPQMAATLNTAQMQHTAQAMAAAVPAGAAFPAGTQSVVPVPAGVPVPGGVVDIAGNPQSGVITYAPAAVPTQDALNHLAQWDPSHMPFQAPVQAPVQALEGQQHQPPPQHQQQHIANPVHPQHFQQQQQPQVKQEPIQQQQQQPQQPPQMQAQQLQHSGQWMDPAAIAGMAPPPPPAAAPAGATNQPAPGV